MICKLKDEISTVDNDGETMGPEEVQSGDTAPFRQDGRR